MIKQNEYYKNSKWTSLSQEEKEEKWQWACNSKEAKKIRKLDKDFQERLISLKKVAYEEKVRKKKQSDDKFLKIVEKCKSHGGPITANNVEKLEVLSYE